MVTHAAWSLPGCGPVHVVHVENSAVAVDTGLPVWSDRHGRRIERQSEADRWDGQSQPVLDEHKRPHKLASSKRGGLIERIKPGIKPGKQNSRMKDNRNRVESKMKEFCAALMFSVLSCGLQQVGSTLRPSNGCADLKA